MPDEQTVTVAGDAPAAIEGAPSEAQTDAWGEPVAPPEPDSPVGRMLASLRQSAGDSVHPEATATPPPAAPAAPAQGQQLADRDAALLGVIQSMQAQMSGLADVIQQLKAPPAAQQEPAARASWDARSVLTRDVREAYPDLSDEAVGEIVGAQLAAEYMRQWQGNDKVDQERVRGVLSRAERDRRDLMARRSSSAELAELRSKVAALEAGPQLERAWMDNMRDAEAMLTDRAAFDAQRLAGSHLEAVFGTPAVKDLLSLAMDSARSRANGSMKPEQIPDLLGYEIGTLAKTLGSVASMVALSADRPAAIAAAANLSPTADRERFTRALTALVDAQGGAPAVSPANGKQVPQRAAAPGYSPPPAVPARSEPETREERLARHAYMDPEAIAAEMAARVRARAQQ